MIRRKRLFLVNIVISIILVFAGCSARVGNKEEAESFTTYFFNTTENTLVAENTVITPESYTSHEELAKVIIKRLVEGSETPSLQGSIPSQLQILESSLKEQIMYINFDDTYTTLKLEEQIMVRASLVYTLTELDFIKGVQFLIEGVPLTNNSGIKIEPITRSDVLMSSLDPNPPTNIQAITLYFAKENDDKLYPESREILVNNSIPIERYIIEQLVKGPSTQGLISTLPATTKINDVKTQDRVCQVDISYDLSSKSLLPISEKLLTYSIVNSLTEITKIEKVVFLMDGKKQTELNTSVDFRRDETLIGESN